MKRGDIVKAVSARDYGKPRPSLVIQADIFQKLDSVVICPLTSDLLDLPAIRVAIEPTDRNGLRQASAVMVDKVSTIPRARCREKIGEADDATMTAVAANLLLLLGLAD